MSSSNRHWPSMFKSKHCNHLQWQHEAVNPTGIRSGSCHRQAEERAPEPKPRWNPKPEQIRILENIFNSGMVNPPREEIRRIRAQLQEYGQVGDANVFYWFQNRKSRSKHKLRHLQAQRQVQSQQNRASNITQQMVNVPTTSSSSSSERSSSSKANAAIASPSVGTVGNGTTELCGEPLVAYLSSLMDGGGAPWAEIVSSEDVCKAGGKVELENGNIYNGSGDALVSEPMTMVTMAMAAGSGLAGVSMAMGTPINVATSDDGVVEDDREDANLMSSVVVFINDVAFEMRMERLNVRAAFGEAAVLLHSSGQPVMVDDWGITLQPLQHGASYYLV